MNMILVPHGSQLINVMCSQDSVTFLEGKFYGFFEVLMIRCVPQPETPLKINLVPSGTKNDIPHTSSIKLISRPI